ncbi:MAG TPA: sorbosone dehydrogenase family protein [Caulobacteraceae bacterium]|jgi:glucose/arabinose dehydrogenase|nr:sorbosone dehydrogenase family protein [Caulobacteraceae bacterium]
MSKSHLVGAAAALLASGLSACGGPSVRREAQMGPDPQLPSANQPMIPAIHIAPAQGWPSGRTPTAAPGLKVAAFAAGLDHPRWLHVLPNGDVLVAESNGPAAPIKRPKDLVLHVVDRMAGAGTPSADRISLLRDADGDGVAETRTVFLAGLHSPFGMALVGNDLYVADTDAVLRFPYVPGETAIHAGGVKVADLPAGPIDHHWTKNLLPSRDGTKLYVTVGSNSNVGENGLEAEAGRAAIYEMDRASGAMRPFATGLRNPNGLGLEPATGALWTVVNERDELGDDLVPDYLTSVKDGGFYGWPYSYWGRHVDRRVRPQRPDLVARAIKPDYGLSSHVAPLGLAFYEADALPGYRGGAFIGEHGSWDRRQFNGYRVAFVPFSGGRPAGPPRDVLTGFLSPDGHAYGRPVGVGVDRAGALLVADDVGNRVWRVTAR